MARTAARPLPEFLTSPVLGGIIATQLGEVADMLAKQASGYEAGMSPMDAALIQSLTIAARQIERYHGDSV